MENPGHAHEDEFFRAGTDGTYDGGPQSLAPVKLEDWVTPPPDVATPEQLSRRRRLKRVVVAVVTALGAVSLLGAALRLTASPSEASTLGVEPAPSDVPRDDREAPASTQGHVADTDLPGTAPSLDTPPATAAMPAAPPMPKSDAAPRTAAKPREIASATTARAASRIVRISRQNTSSYRRVLPSSYQPPTATFPN
ncbi:MAG TPA: hypothetical protein VH142_28230 [Polyangiaceae bacterium]|nr:hypothetical protein [Polyangiaceae bacterium]